MNDSLKTRKARRRSTPALLALLISACGSPDERPPPSPSETDLDPSSLIQYDTSTADARDVFATGTCTDGETQTCRIYLPSHNGVQPCFVGEQACANATWGDCGKAVLVDANNGDEELDPDSVEP